MPKLKHGVAQLDVNTRAVIKFDRIVKSVKSQLIRSIESVYSIKVEIEKLRNILNFSFQIELVIADVSSLNTHTDLDSE